MTVLPNENSHRPLPMSDDTTTDMINNSQTPDAITNCLLQRDHGDEVILCLDEDTEIPVSIVRSLYLPDSVRDGVAGGSLRYPVRTTDRTVERLGLPSPEGLISAEQPHGSWNRPRLGVYDLVTRNGGDGNEYDDYGDLRRSYEITAIDVR